MLLLRDVDTVSGCDWDLCSEVKQEAQCSERAHLAKQPLQFWHPNTDPEGKVFKDKHWDSKIMGFMMFKNIDLIEILLLLSLLGFPLLKVKC